MPQLVYRRELAEALPGMIYSSGGNRDIVSALNDNPRAQQIVTATITESATSAAITLNGIQLSAAGDDEVEVAANLAAAINAEPLLGGALIAEASSDDVVISARVGGIGFDYAAGTGATAALTQANAQAAPIAFGRAVLLVDTRDEGDFLIKLIDEDAAGDILGIAAYTATFEKPRAQGIIDDQSSFYPGGSAVNVLRKGRIWVPTESPVSVGDSVYVRHTASGDLTDLGVFAGGSGTGLAELTQCRWLKGTNAEGLALLQVDFV